MRVLTTTLCYPLPNQPEQGVFVQRRATAVAARGAEVEVLVPRPWCPLLRRTQIPRGVAEPVPTRYVPMLSIPVLGWALDGLAFARVVEWHCRRAAAAGRPFDCIDAHFEYPDAVGAWLAGRRLGLPVVATIRGKIVSLSRRALRRLQITSMLRGVDARMAVSRSLAAWVRRLAGSDLPVDVIPNGINAGVFHPMDRDAARAALGWPAHHPHILAVGHQQFVKGFDRLLAAAPAILDAVPTARFVLVGSRRGERWFQRRLEQTVRRLTGCSRPNASSPAILFHDPVPPEALNRMYNAADVLVCPSRSEGWCNAIAEALAAGTPVVATDVGGNTEQVFSPDLGLIVPDGDISAMSEAVVASLRTRWDRVGIASAGASRSWNHVADEVTRVFTRVLSERRSDVTAPAAPMLHAGGRV